MVRCRHVYAKSSRCKGLITGSHVVHAFMATQFESL